MGPSLMLFIYTTSSYAIAGGSAMNEAAQPHFHSRLSPQSKGRETDSERRQIRRSLFQRHFTLDSRGRAKRETLKKRRSDRSRTAFLRSL